MSQSALRRPDRPLASIDAARWQHATVGVAFIVLVLLGARLQLSHTITVGYVAALVIAPLWLGALGKFRGAASLFVLGIACCLSGFWLLALNAPDHQVDSSTAINNVTLLVGLLLTVGTVLWAKQVMPEWLIGLIYGLGMLLGVSRSGAAAENAWKFRILRSRHCHQLIHCVWRWPLGQAPARISGGPHTDVVGCPVPAKRLAIYVWNAGNGHDSPYSGSWLPRGKSGRRSVMKTMLALACMAVAVYDVLTSLLGVEGYLGAAAQDRSVTQINMTGSLASWEASQKWPQRWNCAPKPAGIWPRYHSLADGRHRRENGHGLHQL